jgi:hypothetical protein
MPKPYTFPLLFHESLQLNISKLKEWGYLKSEQIKSGVITWSCGGNEIGSITIKVNTNSLKPFIELDYKYKEEPRKYKIRLVSKVSNLGKGLVWYFHCPHTKKQCRILYSIKGVYLHRDAFKGCMYESQTHSKFYRLLEKTIGADFRLDKLYSELHKKHLKKTYAGKPTKKYLKISTKINQIESISPVEIAKVLASCKI